MGLQFFKKINILRPSMTSFLQTLSAIVIARKASQGSDIISGSIV